MGKTRDLVKKIKDTKGIFQAKMGSIQDRNGVDLREAEDSFYVFRDLEFLFALQSLLVAPDKKPADSSVCSCLSFQSCSLWGS